MDLDECPCTGKNLDRLIQPAVLAILAKGPLHGYRVVRSLGQMAAFGGRRPDATGVYRFLRAMEERGLVSSAWDLSERGPAKRLFDLSKKGRDCLARWAETLEEYQAQVGRLAQSLREAAAGMADERCACRPVQRRRAARLAETKRYARPR